MKQITLSYFSAEDVLSIHLSKEKSLIGDEEFQEDVILYKTSDEKLVSIDILNFSKFKENQIKIYKDKSVDFSSPLEKIRMLISLSDIMFTDKKEFEDTIKQWGIRIIKEKETPPNDISIKQPSPDPLFCV